MAMVKMETTVGALLVNPRHVRVMAGVGAGQTRVEYVNGDAFYAKGTPDEVHARLFPETNGSEGTAPLVVPAVQVLQWASESSGTPEAIRAKARRALGRGASSVGGYDSVRDEDHAEAARDACGAACALLVQTLPPEQSTRLSEALDAAHDGELWERETVLARLTDASNLIRLLAFAVRRLSGREG